MPILLYMDVHVPRAITIGLRMQGTLSNVHEDDKDTQYSQAGSFRKSFFILTQSHKGHKGRIKK